MSTYFIKCHDLIAQLKKAKLENRLENRLKHFTSYSLLIIDELGYLPIDKEDSKLFFQLIDKRYEKKSTIITTNINFSNWMTYLWIQLSQMPYWTEYCIMHMLSI